MTTVPAHMACCQPSTKEFLAASTSASLCAQVVVVGGGDGVGDSFAGGFGDVGGYAIERILVEGPDFKTAGCGGAVAGGPGAVAWVQGRRVALTTTSAMVVGRPSGPAIVRCDSSAVTSSQVAGSRRAVMAVAVADASAGG